MKKVVLSLVVLIGLASTTSVSAQKSTTSSYEIQRATELLSEGNRAEGLAYLEKELQNNPKSYEAFALKAFVYQTDEEYEKAISCADSSIMYFKGKDKNRLGNLYNFRGNAFLSLGDTAKCLADYRYANKLSPSNASIRNDLIYILLLTEEYEEAEKVSLQAIRKYPDDPSAYLNMAQTCYDKGDNDKAIEYTDLAEQHNAKASFLSNVRMRIYYENKDYRKAISNAVMVLSEMEYNDPALYYLTEISRSHLCEVEDSIKKQYLATNDEETVAYWKTNMAKIYDGCGEYAKSLAVLLQMQNDYPDFDQDYLNYHIGQMYNHLDIPEPAIHYLSKVVETGYRVDEETYEHRGLAYFETGQFDKAEADFRAMIDYNKDYAPWAYYRLGWIKEMRKDFTGALEDYDNSLILRPDYPYVHLMKANLLKDYLSKPEEAKAEYEKVISLEKKQNQYECSMYAYAALGENDKAKTVMDSILVADPSAGNYYDAACLACRMGDKEAGLENLHACLEKGYANFAHILLDDDVDLIRDEERFREMIADYKALHDNKLKALGISLEEDSDTLSTDSVSTNILYEIPISSRSGDTYDIKASINDIPMNFILDTGCSDISITELEYEFLKKNGYISPYDERGYANYSIASGQTVRCKTLNLKEVKVGNLVLHNVMASVMPNHRSELLLGQSVFSKVGKVEIDNEKKVLRIQK